MSLPSPKSRLLPAEVDLSSPAKDNEDLTLVVPSVTSLKQSLNDPPLRASPKPADPSEDENVMPQRSTSSTPKPLKVYEDPSTPEEALRQAPQPTPNGSVERPVLEDKPVNEAAATLARGPAELGASTTEPPVSPEKARQTSRLLESALTRVKAQSLDVHGFRKLQSLIRGDSGRPLIFVDDKFDALVTGLFAYLESPLDGLAPEKVQDIKAQVLATIKLLLKRSSQHDAGTGSQRFQPHVARGLESLLAARARYSARTHIVSGLELLADELVAIGDADEIAVTMTRTLAKLDTAGGGGGGQSRSVSMGLHVLKQLIDRSNTPSPSSSRSQSPSKAQQQQQQPAAAPEFMPNDGQVAAMAALCAGCLESTESAVRMDAVQLCVALHARLGEQRFWDAIAARGVRDDPKSLITYYIVKRQRERDAADA